MMGTPSNGCDALSKAATYTSPGLMAHVMSHKMVYLSLGSNLGDRRANLDRALDALHARPGIIVRAVSPIYETTPVGGPEEQRDYLNAAAGIETTLWPEQLLQSTQRIERDLGRQRTFKNAPRTIDIDILLYADQIRTTPDPVLPHPRMHRRSFVLKPLADLAPTLIHPVLGRSIIALLDVLADPITVIGIQESNG